MRVIRASVKNLNGTLCGAARLMSKLSLATGAMGRSQSVGKRTHQFQIFGKCGRPSALLAAGAANDPAF